MSPTYRGGPNLTSREKEKKKLINLRFKNFAISMELHCNGKNHKSPINQIFLDQTDFFQKTDWSSLVLLYMWVTYELI